MADTAFLKSATTSATFTVISQVLFRFTTFGLNAVILRKVPIELIGIVNVRLTLLYTTILFIAREPFRKACFSSAFKWNTIKNVAWLVVPIGILTAFLLGFVWQFVLELPTSSLFLQNNDYSTGVVLFAASALIELVSEPLNIRCQLQLRPSVRVFSEGLAVVARCFVICFCLFYNKQLSITEYGIAQLVYSLVLLSWFIIDGLKNEKYEFISAVTPSLQQQPVVHSPTLSLAASFFKQSILKQLLGEGERYVMTVFNVISFSEQGVFDVVNNLGSLVVRFFFLPIEDSFYPYFGNCLPRTDHLCTAITNRTAAESEQQTESLGKVPSDLALSATNTFTVLLKTMTAIALLGVTFGVPSSSLLLNLYGGSSLLAGSGPLLMKSYCIYVGLLALNGITECFVSAVAPKSHLDRIAKTMVVISVLFLLSSILLTRELGAVGFIIGNCISMLLRLGASIWFIQRYYKSPVISGAASSSSSSSSSAQKEHTLPASIHFEFASMILSTYTLLCLAVSFTSLLSLNYFTLDQAQTVKTNLFYIASAAVLLFLTLSSIYLKDKSLINGLVEIYRKRKSKN